MKPDARIRFIPVILIFLFGTDGISAQDVTITEASLTLNFGEPVPFNRFLVQEYIRLGQRMKAFPIEALLDGNWMELAHATTIGYKRILRFLTVEAAQLRFTVSGSKSSPVISHIGVYNAPQIMITPVDAESEVYYTLDGSVPTMKSLKYSRPVPTVGKREVQAIAFDPSRGKSSPVSREAFDLPRKNWKILGTNDEKASAIIDGNPSTACYQDREKTMPVDLVVDLGTELMLSGFLYLPDQIIWNPGIVTQYRFFVSGDNKRWELVDQGEFSNIRNNLGWQTRRFDPVKARYLKFRALGNTEGNNNGICRDTNNDGVKG